MPSPPSTVNISIRIFDIVLSLFLILLTSPLLILSLILSALFIGFPPIYISLRRRIEGRVFRHIKIRSMLPGTEVGRIFYEQHRLNGLGRMLRRTHLDELPELFHILSGKMSFVGPRPLLLPVLEIMDTRVRQTVPPGWTGPAQIWLLKTGLLSKPMQVRLDNHYVRRRSLKYNLRLIGATLYYSLKGKPPDLSPGSTEARVLFKKNDFKYKK